MAITNDKAVKFSNEQVRPYCEKMRNLYWEFKSLAVYYSSELASIIPNDAGELLIDDRAEVTQLSGADIRAFVSEANNFITSMEQSGVLTAIQKPCVRHLQAD